MVARRLLACLLVSLTLVVSAVAAEPEALTRPFTLATKEWALTFAAIEADLKSPQRHAAAQQAYAQTLRELIGEANALRQQTEAELAQEQRLLEALGPPPGEGQPPEAAEIAKQRKALQASVAALKARIAQTDLAIARAKTLQEELSKAYRADFRSRLLERSPSPLLPATMGEGLAEIATHIGALARAPIDWFRGLSTEQRQAFFFGWRTIAVFAAALAVWPLSRWLLRRFGPAADVAEPAYARRLVAAIAVAVANGIFPAVLLAAMYLRMKIDLQLHAGLAAQVVANVSLALIVLILIAAFSNAALAPKHPGWRLTRLAPRSARRLDRTILLLAAIYACDWVYVTSTASLAPSVAANAVWVLLADSVEAMGLMLLVRSRLWQMAPPSTEKEKSDGAPAEDAAAAAPVAPERETAGPSAVGRVLRYGVATAAVGSVIAVIIGYVALGQFVMTGLLNSSLVLAALYVARRLAEETISVLSSAHIEHGRLTFSGEERPNLRFWLNAIVSLIVYGVAAYALLLLWGVPRADVDRWFGAAIGGFAIGGMRISFLDIGTAIIVFAVGVMIAGRLRRTLDERVLPRTNLDAGVRNSLATGAGYVGVVIVALIAIGVAGIDLSNIAIVAGALSVGIGFGLQTIVNNFVSGLILLAERPIKVGDLVIVGTYQGFVRNISVRATEIQLYDRSSVILPNSELLSKSVVNMTLKDKTGRVEIRVGVAYGSDPEKVRDILLACAAAHPEVVSWPKPLVFFTEFGASSLDFVLYAFLSDVEKRATVATELRIAINKAFREAGIEIPFAQTDVTIRDLDKLIDALRAVVPAAAPAAETAAPTAPHHAAAAKGEATTEEAAAASVAATSDLAAGPSAAGKAERKPTPPPRPLIDSL
jgi:small-conductance mechanosensitive channel